MSAAFPAQFSIILEYPTPEEISRWVLETVQHSVHIEFYLERLQVGRSDIQRPHDLVGHGNKLEWTAIRGFAMQYRRKPEFFDLYVRPALDFHRQQYHHMSWNLFNPTASTDAMRLGAVDAVCSLLEPRGYQGGCHTFDDVVDIAEKNPIHKVAWMQMMAREMEKLPAPVPDFREIHLGIPAGILVAAYGLSSEKAEAVEGRLRETIRMLRHDHGISLPGAPE